jgi:4-amino-4-deoxy-L-arabinose transferase-like glycosyltransferase
VAITAHAYLDTGQPLPPGAAPWAGRGNEAAHRRSVDRLARRWWRGRPQDPAWARPALLGVLVMTGVLYMWDLGASGWANSFYAAAVQAATKSWKAFFFGSFDSSNFITVDKPPASLWVMDLSARVFGLSSWSLLLPQAFEGVATVALVYVTVRRWASAGAGLIAAAVMALTPVAVLMFRYDNPDSLLVLLLCGAAYATTVATEKASLKWLTVAFVLIGFGFLTKMLQAYLVVPAIAATYFLAAPASWWRRAGHLAAGGVAMVVSSFWWVVAVMAVPAADRPYIGSSQDNSLWNLIFGYNGFGRLTGSENGSVAAGAPGSANRWGATGWARLFGSEMGSQVSWALPAALVLLVVVLALTLRRRRTDVLRASMVLWGGWLLATGAAFSLGQGIIHPYYNVALAPAIGALVGTGTWALWGRRRRWWAGLAMAVVVLTSAIWSYALLDRDPSWHPLLRPVIAGLGAAAALGLAWGPAAGLRRAAAANGHRGRRTASRVGVPAVATLAALAVLAGPASYTLATAATPHTGAIPTAGPSGQGRLGGTGPRGGRGLAGGGVGGLFGRPPSGPSAGAAANGASGVGAPGANFPGGNPPNGAFPGNRSRGSASGGPAGGSGSAGAFGGGGFGGGAGFGGGTAGGLLNASTPSKAITKALQAQASKYTWAAAVVGADAASGYQLASGEPVMAIGGFNGTDPAPSLAQFEKYVSEHKIHYFIGSAGFGFGGRNSANTNDAAQIATWVEDNFTATTVGGVTVYNLSTK